MNRCLTFNEEIVSNLNPMIVEFFIVDISRKYPIPSRPFETVASDFLGPFRATEEGYKYILVSYKI